MNQKATPPFETRIANVKRRWLRWLLWSSAGLVLLLAAGWVLMLFFGTGRLEQARKEADRLDPGWRWDDLQAKRPRYADSENAALTVAKIQGLIGTSWDAALNATPNPTDPSTTPTSIAERLERHQANERLDEDMVAAFRQILASNKEALAELPKLATQPRGRLLLPDDFDYMNTPVPLLQESRNVANLLRYTAQLRAHDGDLDGALVANRCILITSGSLTDEPTLIAQLVRVAIDAIAAHNLERILGQGEAGAAELEKLQRVYEEHLADQVLLGALRGERAGMDKYNYFLNFPGGAPVAMKSLPGWQDTNFATMLEFMNRGVEIAKHPPGDQRREFGAWERDVKAMAGSYLGRIRNMHALMMLPAISKVAEADLKRQATQGCAILAIASERHRLQHGKWPEKIEDLQPLLKTLPIDPFGKGPLNLKRTADGLIIYSVGYDGADNGGNLDRAKPMGKGVDLGFQLWDVAKRRQPAKTDADE